MPKTKPTLAAINEAQYSPPLPPLKPKSKRVKTN